MEPKREDRNLQDVYDKLDDLYASGLQILTLRAPAKQFQEPSAHRLSLIYLYNCLTHFVLSCYETIGSLYISETLLDRMGHWYLASYMLSASIQWMYLLNVYKRLQDHTTVSRIKDFQTTKIIPDRAKQISSKHFENFARNYKVFLVVQIGASTMFLGTMFMDIVAGYLTTGRLDSTNIPHFPNVPARIHAVVLLIYVLATSTALLVIISTFIITGIQSFKIHVLSDIINQALERADGPAALKSCVQDHVQLINMAKDARNICRDLNNPLFMVIYLLLAAQLLYTNTTEEKGPKIILGLICDASCCLTLLVYQCWFASIQTTSLESVAAGAYRSPWYKNNKAYAGTIMMVMRMAQQCRPQKIWLGSLTIERATIIKIIQRSYSFYTALIIMHSKQGTQ